MSKIKYYSLEKILKYNADYNVIYGERSNGKTYAILYYGLSEYVKSGYVDQLAIVRRWEEDFKGKNGTQMFASLISDGNGINQIEKITKGKYNGVYYYSQRWFLARYNDLSEKVFQSEQPFAFGFSITSEEHYKSTSFPNIKTILFDEFITRAYYVPQEFVKFQNLLSTIIRLRTDVKIFMCGNTINKYCPYFAEMGFSHIKYQEKGTIDVYTYGQDNELVIAVEYSDFDGSFKKSNKYFAFDNPKLKMIKNGSWEIDIYPHLPIKYKPDEVKYIYYINFNDEKLTCKVIKKSDDGMMFTYIHRKTTPITETHNVVFDTEHSARRNYFRKITGAGNRIVRKLYSFFLNDKVFYQDNEVGEIVRNYIIWCKKESN